MSSGQTPITTAAPATTTTNQSAQPSTRTAAPAANNTVTPTQGSAPSSTPANRPPATTPANRIPTVNNAPSNNTAQSTQVPSVNPITTVTPSTTRLIGENINELIIITENANYDKLLKEIGNKYLLVEFFAPWCGACMLINKKLVELAASYSGKMIIAKVNIDDCEQVAVDNNVSMMPSFMLFKDTQILEKFSGSSEEKLTSVIQKYVGEPTNASNNTTTTNDQVQQRIETTAEVSQASPLAPT